MDSIFSGSPYQGNGYTLGLDNLGRTFSSAPIRIAAMIPNKDEVQNQERSALNATSTFSGRIQAQWTSADPTPFSPPPSTTPSYHASQPSAVMSGHFGVSLQARPSPMTLSAVTAGCYAQGTRQDSAPSHLGSLDSSCFPSQSSTSVLNQYVAGHLLVPKSIPAFRGPPSPKFEHFSPGSSLPSFIHNGGVDQSGPPLMRMSAVDVARLSSGTNFDSVSCPPGTSTQSYPSLPLNTVQKSHCDISSQASIPSAVGDQPFRVAGFDKHIQHTLTQYPEMSSASSLPGTVGPYWNATTGSYLVHLPEKVGQKIDVKTPSCPEGKHCTLDPSSSCSHAISIFSEGPAQARQHIPSSIEIMEPLTAGSCEQHTLAPSAIAYESPHSPHPTLTEAIPYPLQHQSSSQQPLTQPSYQPPSLGLPWTPSVNPHPQTHHPKWWDMYEQQQQQIQQFKSLLEDQQRQIQQLHSQLDDQKQKVQHLESRIEYQQQPPQQHEQQTSVSQTSPTLQQQETFRDVVPMVIEELFMSEDFQVLLNQLTRQGRHNMSPQLTPRPSPRPPRGVVSTSPTAQKAVRKTNNRSRRASHTSQTGSGDGTKAKIDRKKLDDEKTRKIRECREQDPNMPYDEIGQKNGCSKSTAWRKINQS
ncbi:MAG: hypothetical protein J3Q66DRAFT_416119 [Benniella sp.]|nr:MAG: hypothetical protein J3Q66DRAFT_416119 [Benniella sp.]